MDPSPLRKAKKLENQADVLQFSLRRIKPHKRIMFIGGRNAGLGSSVCPGGESHCRTRLFPALTDLGRTFFALI